MVSFERSIIFCFQIYPYKFYYPSYINDKRVQAVAWVEVLRDDHLQR